MKREIKTYLNAVKKLLMETYGESDENVHVDDVDTLVQYTGYGHGGEGGIRCECVSDMYDVMNADDFPECPAGYFAECINSWSFGVYKV